MTDIMTLADHVYGGSISQPLGNGAREALIDKFNLTAEEADNMLSSLWLQGFKIVPLEDHDRAHL